MTLHIAHWIAWAFEPEASLAIEWAHQRSCWRAQQSQIAVAVAVCRQAYNAVLVILNRDASA